jgi:nicotinamide riboside transporter PnuC
MVCLWVDITSRHQNPMATFLFFFLWFPNFLWHRQKQRGRQTKLGRKEEELKELSTVYKVAIIFLYSLYHWHWTRREERKACHINGDIKSGRARERILNLDVNIYIYIEVTYFMCRLLLHSPASDTAHSIGLQQVYFIMSPFLWQMSLSIKYKSYNELCSENESRNATTNNRD